MRRSCKKVWACACAERKQSRLLYRSHQGCRSSMGRAFHMFVTGSLCLQPMPVHGTSILCKSFHPCSARAIMRQPPFSHAGNQKSPDWQNQGDVLDYLLLPLIRPFDSLPAKAVIRRMTALRPQPAFPFQRRADPRASGNCAIQIHAALQSGRSRQCYGYSDRFCRESPLRAAYRQAARKSLKKHRDPSSCP